jgi:hypothetical protein
MDGSGRGRHGCGNERRTTLERARVHKRIASCHHYRQQHQPRRLRHQHQPSDLRLLKPRVARPPKMRPPLTSPCLRPPASSKPWSSRRHPSSLEAYVLFIYHLQRRPRSTGQVFLANHPCPQSSTTLAATAFPSTMRSSRRLRSRLAPELIFRCEKSRRTCPACCPRSEYLESLMMRGQSRKPRQRASGVPFQVEGEHSRRI